VRSALARVVADRTADRQTFGGRKAVPGLRGALPVVLLALCASPADAVARTVLAREIKIDPENAHEHGIAVWYEEYSLICQNQTDLWVSVPRGVLGIPPAQSGSVEVVDEGGTLLIMGQAVLFDYQTPGDEICSPDTPEIHPLHWAKPFHGFHLCVAGSLLPGVTIQAYYGDTIIEISNPALWPARTRH